MDLPRLALFGMVPAVGDLWGDVLSGVGGNGWVQRLKGRERWWLNGWWTGGWVTSVKDANEVVETEVELIAR